MGVSIAPCHGVERRNRSDATSERKNESGEEEEVEQNSKASIAAAETYLDLLLRDILWL